jgi:hypothetical protein
MIALLWLLLAVLAASFKSKCRLEAENAALRHQVMVLRRQARSRMQLTNFDRLFLVQHCTHATSWIVMPPQEMRLRGCVSAVAGKGQ